MKPALHDELTGALSRSALYSTLEHEAIQARLNHSSFSLLVFDLDHFKSINDAFGHSRGDQVLINFVRRIESIIRSTDLLFRFGGDEFALLLPNTDRGQAAALGDRLAKIVTATPIEGEPPVTVSLSGGLATFPEDANTVKALFEKADQRSYQAKRAGRGRVIIEDDVFDPATAHPFGIESPSRLLERDQALQDFNTLLAELAEPGKHNQRGLVLLTGPAGAGHSRFMTEIRQVGQLQGYGALAIRGNTALKNRYLGALTEALQSLPARSQAAYLLENPAEPSEPSPLLDFPLSGPGGKVLLPALAGWLAARNNSGLLVTIENWSELDLSSQEFLQLLLGNHQELAPYRVILVCGIPDPSAKEAPLSPEDALSQAKTTLLPSLFREGAFLVRKITLTMLTPGGVQAWLRHSLQWEAPSEFVNWLHTLTGGRPIRIREALDFLLKEKVLYYSDAPGQPGEKEDRRYAGNMRRNWQIRPDFAESGLESHLEKLAQGIPHNLPWAGSGATLTEFVGREDYLLKIKQELTAFYGSGTGRLVTLVGPGGIGKTRLSIQAGAELLQRFRDGVFFVPLVGIVNPSEIVPAIGEALRLRLAGDRRAMQDQLFKHLQNRRCLLILDNFEQLLEGAGILTELLAQAPQLRLLVTSREPLKLQMEAGFWLEGLPFPASIEVENFDSYGAVRLFIQKVRQPLAETNQPELDRYWLLKLCRLVEGIPLGLELAATWLRSFSLPQIVKELEQNSGFTAFPENEAGTGEGLYAKLPERHQRLEAVIDWFWARLSRAEQRLVEGLSVFRGGFRIEAAREVVGASPFFLDSLIAKSFLSVSPQGRYEMHELLRQYSGAKLAKAIREESRARLRYARYYAGLLQKRESDLENGQPDVLEEVSADLENVRNAWQWLVNNSRLELISRCVRGMSFFYQYKGFFGEGEETLTTALTRLRTLHTPFLDRDSAEATASEPSKGGFTRRAVEDALARVLIEIGAFLREHSSFEQLCRFGAEAVELARANHQRGLEGSALARMGSGLLWQGKHAEARAYLERGLRLAREAGLVLVQADCLRQLGILSDVEEDYTASIEYSEQGLVLYRQLGNRLWESASLSNIGEAFFQQCCYDEAIKYLREGLALARKINFVQIQTLTSLNLGKTFALQGEYAASVQYLEQGLGLARRLNNTRMEAECLCAYSMLVHFRGDDALAVEYGQEALRITREQGNKEYEGYALTFLGHAWAGLGSWDKALDFYRAGYDLRVNLNQYAKSLDPLGGLAACAHATGNNPLAEQYARQILDFLASKEWQLNGIVDGLLLYATCQEIFEETINTDPELAWQLDRFAGVAEDLRERRYGRAAVTV
ncbi:MAG: diguanylate cyclase [Chloroflexi bacterium]|nr:diguanylate cyclase [Chloroflexota bacterium]OJV88706.1 MAG: hypothetical protein BGO39_04160 [Chloroflexi bacterium 54-19]